MIQIQILSNKTMKSMDWTVDKYQIAAPIPFTSFSQFAGCDPGSVNLGLSKFINIDDKDIAILWQIKLTRFDNPVERISLYEIITNEFLSVHNVNIMTIENSAYAKGFRQTELAEQRAIIAHVCMKNNCEVQMIAPNQIRKAVFGSGNIKAHEEWQLEGIPKSKQPNDALAALSCAYYGMMKEVVTAYENPTKSKEIG